MARDTLLGFPAHTLPYRRGKFITLSTASQAFPPGTPVKYWLIFPKASAGSQRLHPVPP